MMVFKDLVGSLEGRGSRHKVAVVRQVLGIVG